MVLEDKKPCKLDKDGFLEKKIELLKRTQRVFPYVLLYKNYLKSDLLRNIVFLCEPCANSAGRPSKENCTGNISLFRYLATLSQVTRIGLMVWDNLGLI